MKKRIKDISGVIKSGKVIAKIGMTVRLPVSIFEPDDDQPRQYFNDSETMALVETMKGQPDVDQSIGGQKKKNGKIMIVWGERRWRAAMIVGLESISCKIVGDWNTDKTDLYLMSIRENFKVPISPIEEARGIKRLMKNKGWSEAETARQIGIDPFRINNLLRYLKLIPRIQRLVIHRKIEKGTALLIARIVPNGQMKALEILKEETIKRGKAMSPNDANIIIKRFIEKSGGKLREAKKHSRNRTYPELVANRLLNDTKSVIINAEDVLNLSGPDLQKIDGLVAISLDENVKKISSLCVRLGKALRKID